MIPMETAVRKRGRPSLYYTVQDIVEMFNVSKSTVYRKPEEWGGEKKAGGMRFPKAYVHTILKRDGAIEPEQSHR